MGDLGDYIGKIDQDYTITHASLRVLVDTFRKAVAGGDSPEMTFAHLTRWLMGNRSHAEVCVLLGGAVAMLADQPKDETRDAFRAATAAFGRLKRSGPEAFDHLPADHPAPVTSPCKCGFPGEHSHADGKGPSFRTPASVTGLPSHLEQARQAVVEGKADKDDALAGLRCVAPPLGCGKPLRSVDVAGFDKGAFFRDEASADEYKISGWCQACQDKMFANLDEPDDEA